MDIKILNKKTDMEEINMWSHRPLTEHDFPGHTFCALYDGKIAAVAGLRMVEGKMCLLDSMASNQSVPGAIRDEALDELTETICLKAVELGFTTILASTKEKCILDRALRLGFKVVGQILMVKEL